VVPLTGILWVVFAVLLVLWLIGYAVNWGAFIWLLLVLAIIAALINVIGGLTRSKHL
jgi:CDP-diglyceride synthetase